MKRLKSILKQRLSATLCHLGGVVGRRPVERDSTLDRKLLGAAGDTPGVLCFRDAEILQYGVVRLHRLHCIDLDYGAKSALGSWKSSGRRIPRAVALWSHPWMGYYHWIVDVLPKLCLMQEQLGMDVGGAALCYPRWLPAIEDESLQMLGLGENPVIDTATEGGVSCGTVHASRLPGWYQIPEEARLLRDRLTPFAGPGMGKRIYMSRSGRRCVTNEAEVWDLLSRRGFSFVEDRPRSLREQIDLFRDAELIVAPHGAGLSNLMWCRPGTLIVELADGAYYPPFYKNLAMSMGLIHKEVVFGKNHFHWSNVGKSFQADVPVLNAVLDTQNIR